MWFFYLGNMFDIEKNDALVSISEAIATIQDKEELFRTIHNTLKQLFGYQLSGIIQIEPEKSESKIFWTGSELPAEVISELNSSLILNYQQLSKAPFYFDLDQPKVKRVQVETDLSYLPKELIAAAEIIVLQNIRELIYIPLIHRGKLQGFLILALREPGLEIEDQIRLMSSIGNLLAAAVVNTRNFEELREREQFNNFQLEFTNKLLPFINQPDIFLHLATELDKVVPFNVLNLGVINRTYEVNLEISYLKDATGRFKFFRTPDFVKLSQFEIETFNFKGKTGQKVNKLTTAEIEQLMKRNEFQWTLADKLVISAAVIISLKSDNEGEIILFLASTTDGAFNQLTLETLHQLVPQLQLVLENYYAFSEINSLRSQLEQEKTSLLMEMSGKNQHDKFIAQSKQMHQVLRRVKQVAPIDSTVLIEGETGVGKELIAVALHNNSHRSAGPLIKVNCATLPSQLIESELFGHEKGSFTGATERRIGKFELASGGTIFLDEIGELQLELQAKLLRVIQEKEFERIGGQSVIKADVRIVAATNRNLENEVQLGHFRSDLYYRLNVFLISIPPLRDRKEDIPDFVDFFISKYCRRIGKTTFKVHDADMNRLLDYQWPGNIRELEHTVERAVVISQGEQLDLTDFRPSTYLLKKEHQLFSFKTLEEVETEHILRALELTSGRVSGEKGAARLLGINGKTLDSKMRKLGIRREIAIRVNNK